MVVRLVQGVGTYGERVIVATRKAPDMRRLFWRHLPMLERIYNDLRYQLLIR